MSGTKEKTTGKQNAKSSTGKVPASKMAQADALNTAGSELPVTLPGHYVSVGSRPVSTVTLSGDVNAEKDISGAVKLTTTGTVILEGNNIEFTSESVTIGGETTKLSMPPAIASGPGDIELLEVRAVSERGFFRCGRFWPRESVHVFVSDDPEEDNAANALEGDVVVECFISHETATRLKAEPNLKVSVLKKVAGEE
ncbi:TPA: hypothetical protein ACH1TP_002901 [Enterobacter roggenkampii]|uniref:hypothetical protein n=1 Tax=Enterobacteriaceae TaxID=543 RepID=UPI00193CAF0C|nr:hypothetical protein [Lelliottia sp. RWM.1]MBM3072346.1 hypothetical protein [Lelliottia sp. RWM.1]